MKRKILVIAPKSKEMMLLRAALRRESALRDLNYRYVCVHAGQGKVNAAIAATKALEKNPYDLVAVVGYASGASGLSRGEVVSPRLAYYHDVRMPKKFVYDLQIGRALAGGDDSILLTGDWFFDGNAARWYEGVFGNRTVFDMEGNAVAQVAERYSVQVMAVRMISYRPVLDVIDDHMEFVQGENDFSPILRVLENWE